MPVARLLATIGLVVLAGGASAPQAATWYVSASAPDDSGDGTILHPRRTIRAGAALMSSNGGDTVVVGPGTYAGADNTIDGLVAGRAGAWNRVVAQADGSVTITAPLAIPLGDHYLQFEGLAWTGPNEKFVNGRYVKLLRCAFANGPATDNTVTLGIGTNDATPGAQYVLVEDSFAYGHGGRYNVLVYNADRIVLRRIVARHEDGWSDSEGNPQAIVSVYNSTNVLTQNLLLLDSHPPGYFEAALYHPSNGPASAHLHDTGAIILNVGGSGAGWDDGDASSDNVLSDSVIWNVDAAVSINGAAHSGVMQRLTIGGTSSGVNDWSGNGGFTLANSILWHVAGTNLSAIGHAGNVCFEPACSGETTLDPLQSGLLWLPRIEPGSALSHAGPGGTRVGADVTRRLGVSGTLHGEAGYDQPTADALWPWPHEERIKAAMCAGVSTGFCASASLTRYVWEQLGNALPPDIGGEVIFVDGFDT